MRSLALPFLLLVATLLLSACDPLPPLETYWDAPAFSLTDQTGATVTNDDLQGKVWVADFFFTRCPGMCPVLSHALGNVRDAVGDDLRADDARLVGFSVQPEYDTPEILAAYGEKIGATPGQWYLLTGDRADIWSLSQDGFKLAVGAVPDNPANPISHSGKIILVDRVGKVRGFYDGLVPDDVKRLTRDMKRLLDA